MEGQVAYQRHQSRHDRTTTTKAGGCIQGQVRSNFDINFLLNSDGPVTSEIDFNDHVRPRNVILLTLAGSRLPAMQDLAASHPCLRAGSLRHSATLQPARAFSNMLLLNLPRLPCHGSELNVLKSFNSAISAADARKPSYPR